MLPPARALRYLHFTPEHIALAIMRFKIKPVFPGKEQPRQIDAAEAVEKPLAGFFDKNGRKMSPLRRL
jgi:hypothetical protein